MTKKEAIETIKKNWPDERHTILREALIVVIRELRKGESDCMIKRYLLEDIENLSERELGKLYKYMRRYIIGKIPGLRNPYEEK